MSINFRILGKAIADTLRPVVYVVSVVATMFLVGTACIYLAGPYAPMVFFFLGLLGLIVVFIVARYEELMNKYKREQQEIMDILRK